MRRREFMALLGGASITWPRAVHAQQATPVIGFLDSGTPEGAAVFLEAFRRGLGETGYAEGKNVAIDYRWGRLRPEQLPVLAADLVRQQVAVIAATRSNGPATAAKAATSTIPIVFQVGEDPVASGLVASLNRPGGNLTGATRLSTDLIPKRLGVMAELRPKMTAIAMLWNPNGPQAAAQLQEIQQATKMRGLELAVFKAAADASSSRRWRPSRKATPRRLSLPRVRCSSTGVA